MAPLPALFSLGPSCIREVTGRSDLLEVRTWGLWTRPPVVTGQPQGLQGPKLVGAWFTPEAFLELGNREGAWDG